MEVQGSRTVGFKGFRGSSQCGGLWGVGGVWDLGVCGVL